MTERPSHPTLKKIRTFAVLMDSAFAIPGTKIRVGLDPIIGLVPGAGDGVALIMSSYMIFLAHRWGMPRSLIYKMFGNIALDLVLGIIPLAGDILDVFWKSNLRNLELLEEAWHRHKPPGYPAAEFDADLPIIDVEARPADQKRAQA